MPCEVVRHLHGLGYRTVALTDRNNLYGVHEFLETCEEVGVRPLVGATVQKGRWEVVVLVKEARGFSNLCRLLTRRMRGEDTFDLAEELPQYAEGNAILCRDRELLEQWRGKVEDLSVWIQGLERSLYQAAQRLGIPPVLAPEVLFYEGEDPKVHRVLQAIGRQGTLPRGELSEPLNQPLHQPHYQPHRREAAEIAGFSSGGFPSAGFPAEARVMEERFSLFPEALANTARLAERCKFQRIFRGFIFPRLPDEGLTLPGGTPTVGPKYEAQEVGAQKEEARCSIVAQMLRDRVLAGAEERYGELPEGVLDRIEYELEIIQQKGFSEYFLVVADIVRRSPRTCGRGSAAASVVAYCLGITNVDPIRQNLYFERFLNLDREDPPDIDVDFAWDERDAVIEDVFRQYGEAHCARVCNHVFYRFPSALRDTARVFGIPEGEITSFERELRRGWGSKRSKGFPGEEKFAPPSARIASRLASGVAAGVVPSLEGVVSSLEREAEQSYPSPWPEILKLANRITGLPRHLSVHSGGVVITPEPIDRYAPVETAEKGVPILTWEKDGVEAAGLVKIDLLGNRSLAVIRDALENLKQNGIPIGEGFRDPTADPDTQALIARGDTIGVFYVESPAMRQLQAKTGKGDFEHLVIHSSIIRPAANRFINLYVRRLKGEPYQPLHPDLDRILGETYGILCYQEDVSKTAVVLAGFSNADADGLRKILSKKNKEARLARYKEQFYEGASRRGVPRATIDAVWEMILSFEGYSFCKAHSASYAMVSFQSAYLKAHHPAEFMAAVLSNRGGYYTPAAYVGEARRMGLTVLGPDVNQSLYQYTGQGKEIRVGFVEVKGLHRNTVEAILEARSRGAFQSVEDFGLRVELVGEDAEALVSVGALDSVAGGASRTEQLWILLKTKAAKERGKGVGASLFERGESRWKESSGSGHRHVPVANAARAQVPCERGVQRETPRADQDPRTQWEAEYERLGFLLEGHALKLWEPIPERFRKVRGKDLSRYISRRVEMVGWPVTSKEILTREGRPMEFVSFEDETAIFETVLFPKAYERYAGVLDEPRPVIIRGTVQEDLGAVAIHVEELSPLARKNRKER
jgi:DNA polymerase-3 subunit alpha/error-prone DNA polymerase